MEIWQDGRIIGWYDEHCKCPKRFAEDIEQALEFVTRTQDSCHAALQQTYGIMSALGNIAKKQYLAKK